MDRERQFVDRIIAELKAELKNLEKVNAEKQAFEKKYEIVDSYLTRALSSLIADFYSGIERTLKIISEELDGGLPRSENWHKQLLANSRIRLGGRPPVISDATYEALLPFLGFRHVFRSAYGFELDRDRIQSLESKLPRVLDGFLKDIGEFCQWLASQE